MQVFVSTVSRMEKKMAFPLRPDAQEELVKTLQWEMVVCPMPCKPKKQKSVAVL